MSNVVNGNVSDTGLLKGRISAMLGKDGTVVFEDLTEEQKASLKGEKGDPGNPGVYIGSGDMPEGYNVQIDPGGDSLSIDDLKTEIAKEAAALVDADLLDIIGTGVVQ